MAFAALAQFAGSAASKPVGADVDNTSINTKITFGDFNPPAIPTNNLLLGIGIIAGIAIIVFIVKR